MSLLDLSDSTFNIQTFYKIRKTPERNRIIVLEEKDAKKTLSDENISKEEKESINILNTTWKPISWKEQNEILDRSTSEVDITSKRGNMTNSAGDTKLQLNPYKIQEYRIKTALVGWDLKDDNGNPIPYRPELIDKLPVEIVMDMYNKYEFNVNLDEESEKN